MHDQKRILELCVKLGELLLQNGAEIFRVQDTMELVAKAYGSTNFHTYVLTNGLFASVDDENRTHNAEIRHIPHSGVHMGRIVAVNSLSRGIVTGKFTLEQAHEQADVIFHSRYNKSWSRILMGGVGTASFSYLFGGTPYDAFASFFAGIILQMFLIYVEDRKISKIVRNILSAALVAIISFLLLTIGIGNSLDKIIIGGIIPLVPGMALTTSIRDFANADYLSGIIRLFDALLIAGSIAIGVGFVLALIGNFAGVAL